MLVIFHLALARLYYRSGYDQFVHARPIIPFTEEKNRKKAIKKKVYMFINKEEEKIYLSKTNSTCSSLFPATSMNEV